jgi:hypothetical protein
VAPIAFVDLSAMFKAASIPFVGKSTWMDFSKFFVYPAIEDAYYRMKTDLLLSFNDPINVSLDGQYDSPGKWRVSLF